MSLAWTLFHGCLLQLHACETECMRHLLCLHKYAPFIGPSSDGLILTKLTSNFTLKETVLKRHAAVLVLATDD